MAVVESPSRARKKQRNKLLEVVQAVTYVPDIRELRYRGNNEESHFRALLDELARMNFFTHKDHYFVLDEWMDQDDPNYSVRLVCFLSETGYEIGLCDPNFNTLTMELSEGLFSTWCVLRFPELRELNTLEAEDLDLEAEYGEISKNPDLVKILKYAGLHKTLGAHAARYIAEHQQELFKHLNTHLTDLLSDALSRSAHREKNKLPKKKLR